MRRRSVSSALAVKIKEYAFDGVWAENFGRPEVGSKWMVWGDTGAGKSSFVMQLAKYMTRFGRVEYYADEEGLESRSLQRRLEMFGMRSVQRRFMMFCEADFDDILARLDMPRSAEVYIFDSWQTMHFTYEQFRMLYRKYSHKTMIWVSRAEHNVPMGVSARRAQFDCDVKIFVKGYGAKCLGRFTPEAGKEYIIWDDGYANLLKTVI